MIILFQELPLKDKQKEQDLIKTEKRILKADQIRWNCILRDSQSLKDLETPLYWRSLKTVQPIQDKKEKQKNDISSEEKEKIRKSVRNRLQVS